ncbi:MAG: zinc ABC transporter ATP-binding protein, partial [Wolbachia sp.]
MSHINVEKKLNFVNKLNNVNNRVLKIENLALTYDGKRILDNINMFMERGDVITILG